MLFWRYAHPLNTLLNEGPFIESIHLTCVNWLSEGWLRNWSLLSCALGLLDCSDPHWCLRFTVGSREMQLLKCCNLWSMHRGSAVALTQLLSHVKLVFGLYAGAVQEPGHLDVRIKHHGQISQLRASLVVVLIIAELISTSVLGVIGVPSEVGRGSLHWIHHTEQGAIIIWGQAIIPMCLQRMVRASIILPLALIFLVIWIQVSISPHLPHMCRPI